MYMKASDFKAKCLELMDKVHDYHEEIIITKHGKPVARLVSAQAEPKKSIFGFMKDLAKIKGDIIAPIDTKWDAEKDE
ncbi:prevent-host-death protein [candidate division WOR-1 bacterium RIFOXYA2_FULL_37_7]|uniref:Antitoxin n=1 Tax=candidate division WOR-1 bacterium RIFOXYB2_FULL_37_13 TaxID=1802579 RepID=A0A1F4SU05_UNCSA|nr:MAG: prevent-host-death protein [candidate division WOR-1 bacterium RIFOXYA2_FULL_37_7]OGC23807.1 MAG: prevent-host-death protein [candidate division WOR-1 bacterium RIFOXYB2_FULL_37_13]